MRFLILSQFFPPETGAQAIRSEALARELLVRGHEVLVLTAMPNYPTGRIFSGYRRQLFLNEDWQGIPVRRVWMFAATGRGSPRALSYFSFTMLALLRGFGFKKFDWIFVSSPPFVLGITGWLLTKLHRARMLFYVGDLWPDSMAELGVLSRDTASFRLLEKLECWIYRKSDLVSSATRGIRNRLISEKGLAAEKVKTFFNGVDEKILSPEGPRAEVQGAMFLYAGVHGYAQGLDVVLAAADRLQTDTRVRFWFIGDGPAKQMLQKQAAQAALKNVNFFGPQSLETIPEYIRSSRATIVPLVKSSLFLDARPAKLYSSWACGKPVIFCGAGESAALIESEGLGWVVPPEDPSALADAVIFVANNPSVAAEAGERCRNYIMKRHTWSAVIAEWLQEIERVTKQA